MFLQGRNGKFKRTICFPVFKDRGFGQVQTCNASCLHLCSCLLFAIKYYCNVNLRKIRNHGHFSDVYAVIKWANSGMKCNFK